MLKICSKCKIEKDVSNFGKDGGMKDGLYIHCKDCRRLTSKNYYKNNKEKCLNTFKKWVKNNPEKAFQTQNESQWKRQGIKNKDLTWFKWVDYQKLNKKQGYLCACCQLKNKLIPDHNHKTGVIRWLLCQNCNVMLGYSMESPVILNKMADLLNNINN